MVYLLKKISTSSMACGNFGKNRKMCCFGIILCITAHRPKPQV